MTNPIDGLKVDLGLGSYPLTPLASVSWTDVTSDVLLREGIDFDRGRGSQDEAPSPGRLSLTLNNDTATGKTRGRWTIGGPNAMSGWDLRTPIRVRHSTHGTLWVGYVDAAVGGWENGVRPIIRVAASDRLARFARTSLPSLATGELLYDEPLRLFTLREAEGATTVGDTSGHNGAPLAVVNAVSTNSDGAALAFGSAPLPTLDGSTGATFGRNDETSGYYLDGPLTGSAGSSYYAEALVCPIPDGMDQTLCPIVALTASDGQYLKLMGDYNPSTGKPRLAVEYALGSSTGTLTSGDLEYLVMGSSSFLWHHATAYILTGTVSLNVSTLGGLVDSAALSGFTSFQPNRITIAGEPGGNMWSGSVGNVAIYNDTLGIGRLAEHSATVDSFAGDTPAERWARICRTAGMDAADYGSSGSSLDPVPTMGSQLTADVALLDAAQACADVEDGVSFVAKGGAMTFHKRGKRINAAVGLTLLPSDIDHDLDVTADSARMVNDVSVTRVGGATQRMVNALSVAYYDRQDMSLSLSCETDEQALNVAEWIAYERATPQPYVESVTVDLVTRAATVDVADALTADVSTRLQVTPMPTAESPDATLDLFVEGIRDRITHTEWRRTFTTSSAAAKSNVFILDDATYGVLDTGGVLA